MKVSEIVEMPARISPIEGRIMKKLVAKRRVTGGAVTIELNNYTDFKGTVTVYETSNEKAADVNPRLNLYRPSMTSNAGVESPGHRKQPGKRHTRATAGKSRHPRSGGGETRGGGYQCLKPTGITCRRQAANIAMNWYGQMKQGEIPSISLPTRTKHNIEYDDGSEVWKYGDKESVRHAGSAKSALHILKMAFVIWFLKKQIRENRSSTLRELYYISEGWKKAKFAAQDESNFLIEDLEILTDMQREAFHLRPEEDGATIFGPIELKEVTRRGERRIHCRDDVGEAGYKIPPMSTRLIS